MCATERDAKEKGDEIRGRACVRIAGFSLTRRRMVRRGCRRGCPLLDVSFVVAFVLFAKYSLFYISGKKKKPIDEEPLLEVVDGETRFDAVQEPVIRAVRIRAMQRGFARI